MSKPAGVDFVSLPPPIDGMNLIKPPNQLSPTEALLVIGFVYDWGIRKVGATTTEHTFTNEGCGGMFPVDTGGGTPYFVIITTGKIYKAIPSTNTYTDKTGALSISSSLYWAMNQFNGYVMCFNGVDEPIKYSMATDTASLAGFTGPAATTDFSQGWNYKHRQYIIQNNTRSFWYGALDAVTGATTEVPLDGVLLQGGKLLFGTSWAYNQGFSNDELFVVVADNGEVVVYTGDYPNSATWQIVGRAIIPQPQSRRTFIKFGQDILISTKAGVVSLKEVFAGNQGKTDYFIVSRNLGQYMSGAFGSASVEIAYNKSRPFMYFYDSGNDVIWVMNYERGAWSQLFAVGGGVTPTTGMGWLEDKLYIASASGNNTILKSVAGGGGGSAATSDTCVYQTGFMELGTPLEKTLKTSRVLTRNFQLATVTSTGKAAVNYSSTFNATVTKADVGGSSSGVYLMQELPAPAVGRLISLYYTTTATEIYGSDVFYSTGGVY